MSESDPLTDKYHGHVLKLAVDDLIEEKRVSRRLKRGSYQKVVSSLEKIRVVMSDGALKKKVHRGLKNSRPVYDVDINPADSDISQLESPTNIALHNDNAAR